MPNRFARQVPVAGFKPRGLLPDGLLPVARPGGELEDERGAAAARAGNAFGQIADEAAAIEGAREGKRTGLDPNYRPEGKTTIRGRAFEKAASETYQNNLDASLRTDMQAVYEANKSSPRALKDAFDKLQQEYEGKHVFDEIRGDFRATFSRLRLPFQNRALSDMETRTRDTARATLLQNVGVSQTNAAKIAALDPNSSQTAAALDIEIGRIDTLYDEAAKNGDITAEAAQKLKQQNRNSIMGTALLGQADSLTTPEAVAQYRKNFRETFGKGGIRHLDGAGFETIDSQLQTIERGKRAGHNAAETKLQKDVADLVQRAADGFQVDATALTALAASPGAQSAKGQQILALGEQQLRLADALRNKSAAEGELIIRALRQTVHKDGRTPSEAEADLVRFGEKVLKDQRSALQTDMLGLAEKKRIVPMIAPVDLQGFAQSEDPGAAGALAAQIRDRTAQARAVGQTLERSPQFLRPDEIATMKEIVDRGGDKALALAGAIVKGADTDAPAVLRQIGGDAPLLAQAGAILVNGGSLQAARDALQAAELRADKLKPGERPGNAFAGIVRKEYGSAFMLQPEDQSRATAAARAMSETRLTRSATDPMQGDDIYKRAAQEAAGAVFVDGVQFGGVATYKPGWLSSYKVAVPPGVRADAFRDVLRSLRQEDFDALPVKPQGASGAPYTLHDFAAAVPVAVRGLNGSVGYRFALGDPAGNDPKYIRGSDGRPFVLPFEQLSPSLRKRVPGAFLGGQ